MPKHIVFSSRAYTSILAETRERITTETGGIFLGIMGDGASLRSDTWYVVESIDPGPQSVFQSAYFEYDGDYVRHLANKINRLYNDRLDVVGLWHRHPGSMDTFSSTDDETIRKYCEMNGGITISALVNVDPNFRLTIYCATLVMGYLKYKKISFEVDDSKIPLPVRSIVPHSEIEEQISGLNVRELTYGKRRPKKARYTYATKQVVINFSEALQKYIDNAYQIPPEYVLNRINSSEDFDDLIDNYIVDECMYCDDKGFPYTCECSDNNDITFIIGDEQTGFRFNFYMAHNPGKRPCFTYNGIFYEYNGNLIKSILEDYLDDIT